MYAPRGLASYKNAYCPAAEVRSDEEYVARTTQQIAAAQRAKDGETCKNAFEALVQRAAKLVARSSRTGSTVQGSGITPPAGGKPTSSSTS